MLFSELEGKEIIDKNGDRIGLLSDVEFDEKGKVKFIIASPPGVLGKVVNLRLKIPIKLVDSFKDVIFVNTTIDELRKV